MKIKLESLIIRSLKVIAIIFIISSIGAFITTIVFEVRKIPNADIQTISIILFANLGVTMFYRLAMALFFYVFAIFIEKWIKTE